MPNTQLLQEETLNQAQTEAKKLLGDSNETAVTLTVSGMKARKSVMRLAKLFNRFCML